MPSPSSIIVGRSPDDDDPIVRDGEILRVPLQLRDGATVNTGGLMMTDDTDLAYRLRFATPEVRTALGLPAVHIEDGRGGVAGHQPGYAYSPQQLADRAHPRIDDRRRQAFENYQHRLTNAWKNP